MSLLLSLKADELFNLVVSQDDCHNSLSDGVRVFNDAWNELSERLPHDQEDGEKLSAGFTKEQYFRLRPHMININSLVLAIQENSKMNAERAAQGLEGLRNLFKDRLGLTYQLELTKKPE